MYHIGIDIVDISNLQRQINSSDLFLEKVLIEQESADLKIESIAGKVAAKEAIIKTGYIQPGQWKNIIISSIEGVGPIVLDTKGNKINNIKISISHTSSTAVAIALYEKN